MLPQTSQKADIFLTLFGTTLTGLAALLWFSKNVHN
ncbi:LPXTG cell wall anchor domain-containing protein [Lactobacillus gigeriorum]